MQKFLPGEDRGLCEIVEPAEAINGAPKVLGIIALIGHPEKTAMPIFDTRTREVACVELSAWLKARGFEASACRWERPTADYVPIAKGRPRGWRLVTGKPEVPPMPPEFPRRTLNPEEREARDTAIKRRLAYARR